MKRIIISFICHCQFIFICLFLYVNYVHTVPELIPGQELTYKLLNALSLFFDWLPASLCASFIVSYASVFGKSGKHIMIKYSPYIMSQFKYVSIFAIIGTTLVVCSQEVGCSRNTCRLQKTTRIRETWSSQYSTPQQRKGLTPSRGRRVASKVTWR